MSAFLFCHEALRKFYEQFSQEEGKRIAALAVAIQTFPGQEQFEQYKKEHADKADHTIEAPSIKNMTTAQLAIDFAEGASNLLALATSPSKFRNVQIAISADFEEWDDSRNFSPNNKAFIEDKEIHLKNPPYVICEIKEGSPLKQTVSLLLSPDNEELMREPGKSGYISGRLISMERLIFKDWKENQSGRSLGKKVNQTQADYLDMIGELALAYNLLGDSAADLAEKQESFLKKIRKYDPDKNIYVASKSFLEDLAKIEKTSHMLIRQRDR